MAFTSLPFLAFVTTVVLLMNAARIARTRAWLMLVANVVFLLSYTRRPTELLPLLGFIALGYLLTEALRRTRSAGLLWFGGAALLGTFVSLKKYAFVPAALTPHTVYAVVGISYIFFRVLHLMIDAKQGELQQRLTVLSFFNYTASFLTLTAGPIQRYEDFARETSTVALLDQARVYEAFARIVQGFLRIAVLSAVFNYVFAAVSAKVLDLASLPSWPYLLAVYGASALSYTLFLYANFAGYMDVVIGVSALLGQRLPENFDHPFRARSFLDFWARWHITLSVWFRTYLFNPLLRALAGRIKSPALAPYLAVAAFFVTFLLMGVWHGATSVFVVYGLFMATGASVNKLWQVQAAKRLGKARYKALCEQPLFLYAARGLTIGYFALGLSCLWLDLHQLSQLSARLGAGGWLLVYLALASGTALAFAAWDSWRALLSRFRRHSEAELGVASRNLLLACQVLLIFCVSSFFHQSPEFVYRAF